MSRKPLNKIIDYIAGLTERSIQTAVVVIVLVVLLYWGVKYLIQNSHIGIENKEMTISTPTTINSIKSIGEWEFLTISDEELIDTVRKGMISNSELIRIYYGNIRLGINLNDTVKNWIYSHGDTVDVILPKIRLLDEDFIDEAKTEAFYETGKWKANELNGLYERARKKMLERCLTKENIENAEQNAIIQMSNMFRILGYNTINIQFGK